MLLLASLAKEQQLPAVAWLLSWPEGIVAIVGLAITVVKLYLDQRKARADIELSKRDLKILSRLAAAYKKGQESQQALEREKLELAKGYLYKTKLGLGKNEAQHRSCPCFNGSSYAWLSLLWMATLPNDNIGNKPVDKNLVHLPLHILASPSNRTFPFCNKFFARKRSKRKAVANRLIKYGLGRPSLGPWFRSLNNLL